MYKSLAFASVAALSFATGAQAASELVTNGNFSSTYSTGSQSASTPSQLNYNGYGVTGWTNSPGNGYAFVFNPTLAGSAAYTSNGQYGDIQLYTSANGGSATAPASLVSPVGGNFLASDGLFQRATISQTINNLSVGTNYQLSFYWAASQQAGFNNSTTDRWTGTFGNASFATATVTNPDKGFTPWTKFTQIFTAGSTSQTLSFLADGGPVGGQPPCALLDGGRVTAGPEPASWAMALGGFGLIGAAMRRRRPDVGLA